ncbi:CsiV family protein [Aestuariirhabdus sp. LZHN29]|uniref:CsiV family protein n=1 Tax=Aestuariirhabdus sp. LZHN29 TaxID=3417462 RepID=UPI003CE8452B
MNQSIAKTSLLAAAFAASGMLSSVQAETTSEPDEERWFQVELIVFEHRNSSSNEQWSEELRKEPVPDDEAGWEENVAAANPSDSVIEGVTTPVTPPAAEIPPVATAQPPLEELTYPDGSPLLPPATDDANAVNVNATTNELSALSSLPPARDDSIERPLVILPDEALSLQEISARLNDDEAYQVRFHHSWRQSMVEAANAPWIRIEGTERFGNTPVLSGSVSFSLKRYLHIRTRLSITEFEPFQNLSSEIPDDYVAIESAPELLEDGIGLDADDSPISYEPLRRFDLIESRRMRSGELHYIDSPVLGVLVKITPYEAAEPETEAPPALEVSPQQEENTIQPAPAPATE